MLLHWQNKCCYTYFSRTLHEAYQFLSWKYSRMRDLNKTGEEKAAEAEDVMDTYRDIRIDEDDEDESAKVVELTRPKTATDVKRKRRVKSAKASFAGRHPVKVAETIVEVTQENVTDVASVANEAEIPTPAVNKTSSADAPTVPEKSEANDIIKSDFLDLLNKDPASLTADPSEPVKQVELENENMEEYLERMAGVIARMIAEQIEAD